MDMSVGSLFTSLVVSTIGFGIFTFGKKQVRVPQIGVGVVLMICPYFLGSPLAMCAVAGGLIAGLWLAVRMGM